MNKNDNDFYLCAIYTPDGNIYSTHASVKDFINYRKQYMSDNNIDADYCTWECMRIPHTDIYNVLNIISDTHEVSSFIQLLELEQKLNIVSTEYNKLVSMLSDFENAYFELKRTLYDSDNNISFSTYDRNIGYFLGRTNHIADTTLYSSAEDLLNCKFYNLCNSDELSFN